MANGGIIGPNNPVGKIITPKVSVFSTSGTLTTDACTANVDVVVVAVVDVIDVVAAVAVVL